MADSKIELVSGLSKEQSWKHIFTDIMSGRYRLLPFTASHAFVIFVLNLIAVEIAFSDSGGFVTLFGLIAAYAIFPVYAHMMHGYMRIMLFGADYSGPWSTQNDNYSEVQRGAVKKLYIRFALSLLVLGLPFWIITEINTDIENFLFEVLQSEFLMVLLYIIPSYFVTSALGMSHIFLTMPYGSRAIGAQKMSVKDEAFLSYKQSVNLLAPEKLQNTRVWILITAAMLWWPEFIIFISDANGWLTDGYNHATLGSYLYALELTLLSVYKCFVLSVFTAFIFLRMRTDVCDEILNKSDQELMAQTVKVKRPPKKPDGFIASMNDDTTKK